MVRTQMLLGISCLFIYGKRRTLVAWWTEATESLRTITCMCY